MTRKIVVIGSAGQLGVELVREFEARGYSVHGLERADLDITNAEQTERALEEVDPGVVLNSAAYNQVDLAEREPLAAYMVNALGVHNLAVACRQLDARLVHFSTDYVFDGTAGRPYTEQDATHPLGAYGVSKLAGEFYARAYLGAPLIIRTSGVYGIGGLANNRGNFLELMLRLAGEQKPIRVVEDHVGSPTYAPALAARTADLVERRAAGVFHIGGGTPINWYEYARKILALAGAKDATLKATNEREYRTAAHRPKYSALSNKKMESVGLAPMPSIDAALETYFELRRGVVG